MNSLAQLKVGECDCFHISLRFLMRLWAAVRRLNYFHCIVSLSNLLLVCFAGLLFLSRVCDHCCFDFLCSRLFSSWQTHSSPFTEMLMCAPKMSLKDNQGLRHAEANQLFGKIKIKITIEGFIGVTDQCLSPLFHLNAAGILNFIYRMTPSLYCMFASLHRNETLCMWGMLPFAFIPAVSQAL